MSRDDETITGIRGEGYGRRRTTIKATNIEPFKKIKRNINKQIKQPMLREEGPNVRHNGKG